MGLRVFERGKGIMLKKYKGTICACFIGYIVQAIVNNFVPLLFLTFQSQYGISLSKITMLVTFNFGLQILIDLLSVTFVDKIGYRFSAILAHIFSAAGFVLLTILPELTKDPFHGILIAVMIYAIGGGLLEVLISPIVEACPSDNKEKTMSLLHSFYCWGHVGVVLLSTLFFAIFGIRNWKILALFWALIPVLNTFMFSKVPIAHLIAEDEEGLSMKELLKENLFWIFIVLMICSGASEQAVSQWASTFMENGLHISKTLGDLIGPMAFAICMGTARALYGKYGDRIKLESFMTMSALACIASYIIIGLLDIPIIGVIGCSICGFAVGIMWPGTFSMSAARIRNGGTTMFALMALAGDLGCAGGPTLVGMVSDSFSENLRIGILAAIVFPLVLLIGIWLLKRDETRE